VLAGSIQKLAFESKQRSESLLEALCSMSEAATRLSVQGKSTSANESESQDGYLEAMRVAVAELHSNERSFAQIAQIVACGTRLREDICAARQSFSVGAVFAEGISRARTMLK